jgi:hypothetical protein
MPDGEPEASAIADRRGADLVPYYQVKWDVAVTPRLSRASVTVTATVELPVGSEVSFQSAPPSEHRLEIERLGAGRWAADDSIPGTSEEKKGFAFARAMTPRAWMEWNP